MIRKIKRFMEVARRRAQILAEAREVLRQMEGQAWEREAGRPTAEMMNTLMILGLTHLMAVKTAQEAGKQLIARVAAHQSAQLN